MRLRDRKAFARPEVMIIPMIDIIFFLYKDSKLLSFRSNKFIVLLLRNLKML